MFHRSERGATVIGLPYFGPVANPRSMCDGSGVRLSVEPQGSVDPKCKIRSHPTLILSATLLA